MCRGLPTAPIDVTELAYQHVGRHVVEIVPQSAVVKSPRLDHSVIICAALAQRGKSTNLVLLVTVMVSVFLVC